MFRKAVFALWLVALTSVCLAQLQPTTSGRGKAPAGEAPPHSEQPNAESSSKQTQVDLSAPSAGGMETEPEPAGIGEFKKYDPHRADKDLEVAEYYAKQGNYRAALWRYQDALEYKPNDPEATFKLARAYERLGQPQPAARYIVLYLRLAPDGEFAAEAKKLQEKLRPEVLALATTPEKKRAFALVDEGALLLGRHDFRGAIARFQAALQADPENEDATFFLADAYQQNGLMDEARATYSAYLRMDPNGPFADSARIALDHLPSLRGEGIPAKPELPTSLPSESPR
jgi:Tfp pilus assembly protein PilF